MQTEEGLVHADKKTELTPKAILNFKYGNKAVYTTEEVKTTKVICPGLAIPQQGRSLYRCHLQLPEISVTSGVFSRKKEAEQSAAKLAMEKLGIVSGQTDHIVEEPWDALSKRLTHIFSKEFLSSGHPLAAHLKIASLREGVFYGSLPISVLPTFDSRINSLCKRIDPTVEDNPSLVPAIIRKAAEHCISLGTSAEQDWIWCKNPPFQERMSASIDHDIDANKTFQAEALYIPNDLGRPIETFFLDVHPRMYYMDLIANKLDAKDCSHVLLSRAIGTSKPETRVYYLSSEDPGLPSEAIENVLLNEKKCISLKMNFNLRAAYISGQRIFGDAVMASLAYKSGSDELFYNNVSISTYYRILIGRMPDGIYKLSRKALFAAKLPTSFQSRKNWRGSLPRSILSQFCQKNKLLEPIYSTKIVESSESACKLQENETPVKSADLLDSTECALVETTVDDDEKPRAIVCEIKILSRRQDIIVEYSSESFHQKEDDAVQNASLKLLTWLASVLNGFDMNSEKLSSSGFLHGVCVNAQAFQRQFSVYLSINKFLQEVSEEPPCKKQKNGIACMEIVGPDSGVFPSSGSFVCISYAVYLMHEDNCTESLETNDTFEFEIGADAVVSQIESCVTQLSVNQLAHFVTEIFSEDLILSKPGISTTSLSSLFSKGCLLKYKVKLSSVTEPPEEKMEQALFCPPLSKQRAEYTLKYIRESNATSLVDFGCGSGSLFDSLLSSFSLEKFAGVDISERSLCQAAKLLYSKISGNFGGNIIPVKNAVLYRGSILDFDSRLCGFDIATCLEVIEHMEEHQVQIFGDVVLSSFCPRTLIVSTPNYEYNAILNKMHTPDDEVVETSSTSLPLRYRNHDHKFEWTREQFSTWAFSLALKHGYSVEFGGVGGSGNDPGFASQIAVFRRESVPLKCENGHLSPYAVIWEWPGSYSS